jgi:hypothetical protein
MDTIDIKIDFPAPPPEAQQAIEHNLLEKAARAGAIHAHVLKKTGIGPTLRNSSTRKKLRCLQRG